MSLTPALPLRRFAAAALACLSWASGVQAGVVVSIETYQVANPPQNAINFDASPFAIFPTDGPPLVAAAGFLSSASAQVSRRSRLPVAGEVVSEDVSNASGLQSSTVAGQTVEAGASLELVPSPLQGPAVARSMTERFANHASASTLPAGRFWNSQPVSIDGTTYEAEYFFLERGRRAESTSAWFETWTADTYGRVDITLGMDGHLGKSDCDGVCLTVSPSGTDASRTLDHYVRLDARFVVFDLNTLIACKDAGDDDPDAGECSYGDLHPLPLITLTARFGELDAPTIDFEDEWALGFDAIAGHRYMVMGVVEVEAFNGGEIDFFHTMQITDIDVAQGVLRSDVDGRDVSSLFGPDVGVVPAPATLWLVLLGGLATRIPRRRAQPA